MSLSSSSSIKGLDTSRERTRTPSNNPVVGSISNSGRKGRLKGHNRSSSHNKALNKSYSSSVVSTSARPHLNRSKSTDGLLKTGRSATLKRNNRSFNKLSGLQPLTKTKSNQSLKSNKSNTSLKGLTPSIGQVSGLKVSGKKEKAIMRLNEDEDDPYQEYEDMDNEYDIESNEFQSQKHSYRDSNIDSQNSDMGDSSIPPSEEDLTNIAQGSKITNNSGVIPQNSANIIGNSTQFQTLNGQSPTNPKSNSIRGNHSNSLELEGVEYTKQSSLSSSITTPIHDESVKKQDNDTSSSIVESSNLLKSEASSDEFLANNLYGGSLLLSQSTGMTKKLNGNAPVVDTRPEHVSGQGKSIGRIPVVGSASDNISGISFRANPIESKAEPITTNKNVAPNNSYQPGQTIFNNLQRTNSQYLLYRNAKNNNNTTPRRGKQQQNPSHAALGSGTTNFSNFLNTSNTNQALHINLANMENRTQQRLWLQRENSLMDVLVDPNQIANLSSLSLSNLMFAHNYNQSTQNIREMANQGPNLMNYNDSQNQIQEPTLSDANSNSTSNVNGLLLMVQNSAQNSIQTRTEFEKLNREYLNVRRHLNPVAKSIDRIHKVLGNKTIDIKKTRNGTSEISNNHDSNKNTFKEFSPLFYEKEQEINLKLKKQWQEALILSLSSASNPQGLKYVNSQDQDQDDQQNLLNSRILTSNQSLNNFRTLQTPATRAVKLAAQNGNF